MAIWKRANDTPLALGAYSLRFEMEAPFPGMPRIFNTWDGARRPAPS